MHYRSGVTPAYLAACGQPPERGPQMPAYHLVRRDRAGITLVNIGVGPANAKTMTDHIAVLRPHAWIMLGHCAGLRNTQQLGDYVLAHAYVRDDHVLDDDLPLWVPIPALAEVQLALEAAVAEVTQLGGYELKRIMRTGTVASVDNRNWELLPHRTPERPLQPEPRGGAGHGERHHRRQRFPLPRALRHLAVRLRQASCTGRSSCLAWPTSSTASASISTCASACRPSPTSGSKAMRSCTAASCAASPRWHSSKPASVPKPAGSVQGLQQGLGEGLRGVAGVSLPVGAEHADAGLAGGHLFEHHALARGVVRLGHGVLIL